MGLSQPVKELFLALNSSSSRQDLGNNSTVETIRSQQYQVYRIQYLVHKYQVYRIQYGT